MPFLDTSLVVFACKWQSLFFFHRLANWGSYLRSGHAAKMPTKLRMTESKSDPCRA
jgi:hypothetical protein